MITVVMLFRPFLFPRLKEIEAGGLINKQIFQYDNIDILIERGKSENKLPVAVARHRLSLHP